MSESSKSGSTSLLTAMYDNKGKLLLSTAFFGGLFGVLAGVAQATRGSEANAPGATKYALKALAGGTFACAATAFVAVQTVKYTLGVKNVILSFFCFVFGALSDFLIVSFSFSF